MGSHRGMRRNTVVVSSASITSIVGDGPCVAGLCHGESDNDRHNIHDLQCKRLRGT
jgi:hypothetical protein